MNAAPAPLPTNPAPTCPSCRSPHVGRKRLIYEAGTADTSSSTLFAGGVGNRSAGGVALSSGRSQSKLAERFAPPAKAPVGVPIIIGFFLVWVGLYVAGHEIVFNGTVMAIFGGIAAVFVIGGIAGAVENRQKYPAKLASYEREWGCLTCGHEWTPTTVARRDDDFDNWIASERAKGVAVALPELPIQSEKEQSDGDTPPALPVLGIGALAEVTPTPAGDQPSHQATPTGTVRSQTPQRPNLQAEPARSRVSASEERTSWLRDVHWWLIVLLLVACYPLGLVVLWMKRRWHTAVKVVVTVIAAPVALFATMFVCAAVYVISHPEAAARHRAPPPPAIGAPAADEARSAR